MAWVDPLNFFYTFSETLTDVLNTLVHTPLPVLGYGAISNIPKTNPGLTHSLYSLTHIYCYFYDMITAVQSGTEEQLQVCDVTVWAFRWLFLSFPGKMKDLVSMKKLWAGEGYWICVKEFLG